MTPPIYLDYNGTTPHAPEVIEAMRHYLESEFGNPSSSHWYGVQPKKALQLARRQVAGLLRCNPEEIVFTSGGTESNNHAIKGVALAQRERGGHIITSSIEHPAVLEVCRALKPFGFETTCLPVDRYGSVDPKTVEAAIRADTILITIMHSNNEVGTIQPIQEIGQIAAEHGITVHTDAAQSMGKILVDVKKLNVDLLSIAGHKLYGPKGIGVLYIKEGVHLDNFCHGAGQEGGLRGGTENVMEIAGLGKACEIANSDIEKMSERLKTLRDRLHDGLVSNLGDSIILNGHPELRLPNTLSLCFKDHRASHLLGKIGHDVCVSAGAACHSDTVDISHVLRAMKVPWKWAAGCLRFSVGRMTTTEEIDRTVVILTEAAATMT